MLGFGKSPKPKGAQYTVAMQARSIAKTVLRLNLGHRPIIVGHSLGALVAIELAKRYPFVIQQLVLCSPPLYREMNEGALRGQDELLKELYKLIRQHPEQLPRIALLAARLGIITKAFELKGEESASIYVAALEASIIHQTSLMDIQKLRLPITILYGKFDPLVVSARYAQLAKTRPNVTVKGFAVGHEIIGRYQTIIATELRKLLTPQ